MTMDSVRCNSCNIGSLDEHFKDEFSVETREILSLFEVLIGEKRGIIDSFFNECELQGKSIGNDY